MNEHSDISRWLSWDALGGLAPVSGMLGAAGCTALVQSGPPASCRSDTHCLLPGSFVPTAGADVSLLPSHAGADPMPVAQPACRQLVPRALRTVVPQSLIDGERKYRGWLSERCQEEGEK